jgi:hypothetical protein
MPLIAGEDPKAYESLRARVKRAISPKDMIEEIWLQDIVNLVWESLRLRRLKTALFRARAHSGVENVLKPLSEMTSRTHALVKGLAQRKPEAVEKVNKSLSGAGLTMDAVTAETLFENLEAFERIEAMIASLDARRNNILREIERHREALATARRRAAETEVEDAEFREIAAPAATP